MSYKMGKHAGPFYEYFNDLPLPVNAIEQEIYQATQRRKEVVKRYFSIDAVRTANLLLHGIGIHFKSVRFA